MSLRTKITYTRAPTHYLAQDIGNPSAECNAEMSAAFIDMDVVAHDARAAEAQGKRFVIDEHGFCLIRGCQNTLGASKYLSNDDAAIKRVAYAEVTAAVRAVWPAAEVNPFHHAVRSSDAKGFSGGLRAPARNAHCDYSVSSAMDFMDGVATDRQRQGRFLIINAWRNIGTTPITNHHLAVCNGKSVVCPDDYVCTGFRQPGMPEVQCYSLEPGAANRHEWWYYPNMVATETLLFMQYDSNPSSPSRFCFHTAIPDNTKPNMTRQSCEVRMAVFLPDPSRNTIRRIFPAGVVGPKSKMLEALKYPEMWPSDARSWLARGVYKGGKDVRKILEEWVAYSVKDKEFGLDRMSPQERGTLVNEMMQDNLFERTVKQHFDKPKWYQ